MREQGKGITVGQDESCREKPGLGAPFDVLEAPRTNPGYDVLKSEVCGSHSEILFHCRGFSVFSFPNLCAAFSYSFQSLCLTRRVVINHLRG